MSSFEAVPSTPTPEKKVKPLVVRKVGEGGKIIAEEIFPAAQQAKTAPPGLEAQKTKSKPTLEVVQPVEPVPIDTAVVPEISERDIIRVQGYKDGRKKESVFEKGKKVLESEKRNPWNVAQVAPAPELAPRESTPDMEISGAQTWGQLADACKKLDMIEADNGSLYAGEYFSALAQDFKMATEEDYPTIDSPIIQSLPEKYGIRAKFIELLSSQKPLKNIVLDFPKTAESTPQPLKPLPESAREVEPPPMFMRPDLAQMGFTPLPEAPQVEPLPTLEPLTSQDMGMKVEFGFDPSTEKMSEEFPNQYKTSAEYQDASDILNKEASQLREQFQAWKETVKKQNFAEIITSPYFKEYAAKMNQARVAARLADRTALYDMLEQEYAELSNSRLENPNAVNDEAFETVARMDEIKRERQIVSAEVARLDNEFMELEVNAQIQRHKKENGYTPEEERALDEVTKFYNKLNETEQQLRAEKSGLLNKVKSFFGEKKRKIEALTDIANAYRARFEEAQQSANVARNARTTRLAGKSAVKG